MAYIYREAFLGIAGLFGSWRLRGLAEMHAARREDSEDGGDGTHEARGKGGDGADEHCRRSENDGHRDGRSRRDGRGRCHDGISRLDGRGRRNGRYYSMEV